MDPALVAVDQDTGLFDAPIVDARIIALARQTMAEIVDSAPASLDTLNELAASLGDDPNFSATILGLIAAKIDSSTLGQPLGPAQLTAGGKIAAGNLGTGVLDDAVFLGREGGNTKWLSLGSSLSSGGGIDITAAPYNADSTGVSDVSVAVNTALAGVAALGGMLIAPAGTYKLDHPVGINASVTVRGAGKRLTKFVVSSSFETNHPAAYAMWFQGTGSSNGTYNFLQSSTPVTSTGTTVYKTMKSGWSREQGNAAAAGSKLNFKTFAISGAGTTTFYVDQSNDPTFATGVTTSAPITFTDAEPNATKTFGGNTALTDWVATYFRIRMVVAGTPTSWPMSITFVNDYAPIIGLNLSGFSINANGTGSDADGRWNSKGLLIDRAKWVNLFDLWFNKQRGFGLRCLELWDSYIGDVKVLKCGDATAVEPAVGFEPFDDSVTGSTSNNTTIVQLHCEDNKYVQVDIGRRCRRLRFLGLKCHGDLADDTVMTIAPHVRVRSGFTNQFFGCSMNRAGGSHFEFSMHPTEQADFDAGVALAGGKTGADRNSVVGCYFDSSRTNTTLAPAGTPSVKITGGAHNRFAASTWSANTKAADVATGLDNVGNYWAEDCQFQDIVSTSTRLLLGDIRDELTGQVYTQWRNWETNVRYSWDGTTLRDISSPPMVTPSFTATGALVVATGKGKYTVMEAGTLASAVAQLGTTSSSGDVTAVVKKNGGTVFTLTVTAGSTTSTSSGSSTTVAVGDRLSVDITGAGTGATDLTVTAKITR